MEVPYVNQHKHKEENIEKLKEMGRRNVKKLMITSFISSGSSGNMSRDQIAKVAHVETTDKEMMRHIDIMLKRHDERKKTC